MPAGLANDAWRARRAVRRVRRVRLDPAAILGALPPPALILAGIVSVQFGAGLARQLFAVVPPASVTLLRLWSSAILMLALSARKLWRLRGVPDHGGPGVSPGRAERPPGQAEILRGVPGHGGPGVSPGRAERPPGQAEILRGVPGHGGPGVSPGRAERPPGLALRGKAEWRSLGVVAVFGLTLAVMNFAIYQSFARIPLGVAVTIEFLGPLAVAIAASRRLVDLIWVALAGGGVALLTKGGGHITLTGVLFALVAAAGWAAYILASAATGRRFPGSTGLTLAMVVAALAVTPVGVTAGAVLLRPGVLAIGACIGLLSSVIPYSLELEALRRVPPRVFGVLMSLEPAVAALVGLFLLGQVLAPREWIAIGSVMAACIGAMRGWSAGGVEA
jgi:threonine/homoserine efflux transporter RhtA